MKSFPSVRSENDRQLFGLMVEIVDEVFERATVGDNLITVDRVEGFRVDDAFASAFAATATGEPYLSMGWRLNTLAWAADQVRDLEGDFVECGVFRGFKSLFMYRYLAANDRYPALWLYDTFAGLPDDLAHESPNPLGEQAKPGLIDFVRDRFASMPTVEIVEGRVPEILAERTPERVAWLHLDMNSATAEIGALEHFWPRLVPGAVIVLDDYGHWAHRDQFTRERDWFRARGISVLELASGQGMVVVPPGQDDADA